MKHTDTFMKKLARLTALGLALALMLAMPASAAGLWDLLFGSDEAEEASAQVTLPPAEALATPEEAATATPAPMASLAPVPDAAIEDDGLLRVALMSMGTQEQLDITVAGVYALEGDPGFRFDRGARLALSVGEGSIYMAVSGLTIDMGPTLTLTRHKAAAGEENGLYIDQSEKETLYAGDLTVYCEEGGLRAVLELPVEEYLLGVVAYEMSDSFPIEALKTQAVAARTYAMQRKWQSADRDYDVVDTTADQVFKGYDPEYTNVAEAVEATRGVVGLYDGTFAVCYYTASNGGQTALPSQIWGIKDSDGYLAMTEDPYDVENPKSLQSELTVSPDCAESPALKAMLEAQLGEILMDEGYGEGEWELLEIASVEPVEPRFEGSRMYDGLAFDLRVKLLEPVATPEPEATPEATAEASAEPTGEATTAPTETAAEAAGDAMPTAPDEPLPTPTEVPREWVVSGQTRRVVLDVYKQVKGELGLGLNGTDCELVSVDTEADADGEPAQFTILLRRFGHGVGMSQRGAQWMAGHYNKNWQEIFAFYYPGLSVERMSWPEDVLTDLDALPDSVGAARPRPTPTPTPAPLPALEAGERYAKVTADMLNLRQQPTTASMALTQLPRGRRLIVRGEADENGWVSVHTAELEGYVKEEYLEYE